MPSWSRWSVVRSIEPTDEDFSNLMPLVPKEVEGLNRCTCMHTIQGMDEALKQHYDFSQGERGAVEPASPGKTRITIRIDNEILDWFRGRVHEQGGGNYQTLMNQVLREHIERGSLEETLRRVLCEEFAASTARGVR